MGDFVDDSIAAARFGFSWFEDRLSWAYLAAFFAVNLAVSLAFAGLLESVFPGLSNHGGTWARDGPRAAFAFGGFAAMIQSLAKLAVGFAFIGLFSWVASSAVSAYARSNAMARAGLKTIRLRAGSVARFVLLSLLVFLAVLFNWLSIPILLLSVAFWAALALIPLLGMGGLLLVLLLLPAYLLAMIYNSARLSLSMPAFLNEELSMSESLNVSWKLTQGRALGTLARLSISMLICAVVVWFAFAIPKLAVEIIPAGGTAAFSRALVNALSSGVVALAFTFAHTSVYLSVLEKAGISAKAGQNKPALRRAKRSSKK